MTVSSFKFPVRVGILGGGQLARMLACSCQSLGVIPSVYANKADDCATQVVDEVIVSDGSDARLKNFINQTEMLVIENEFIDLDQLERCLSGRPLVPSITVLRLIQSKLEQKRSFKKHGIASLDFAEVSSVPDLKEAVKKLGSRIVLKTARFGYDGKGTFIFSKGADRHDFAHEFFKIHPDFNGYAEPLVLFKKELAVIVARSQAGEVKTFPVVESNQKGGVCQWVKVPAPISSGALKKAQQIAVQVISKMQGVGVFGVELFQLPSGKIVINEIAPRVHNTGHYSQNACAVSQFEQHLRCALGLPLLETRLIFGGAAMVNILGDSAAGVLGRKNVSEIDMMKLQKISNRTCEAFWIHWYGKIGPAAGRKLGHINVGAKTSKRALEIAEKIRKTLKI